MRSPDEYAALNGAAVRASKQKAKLERMRVARKLVTEYVNENYDGHIGASEQKLIKAIAAAIGGAGP